MRLPTLMTCASLAALAMTTATHAAPFDGQADYATDALGYYYAITGGKFPTGTTPNGNNGSGGTFRFLMDDAVTWGRDASQSQVWQKDDWFPENAGLALTLKNGATIVYDNNGIEDGTYGDYYDASNLVSSNDKPGLYRGYSMSNNFDWIYAGYFKIEEQTTVTDLIGYFDAYAGFDPDHAAVGYRMNIWSNVEGDLLPIDTGGFDGDVFSSDVVAGTFATSDTGVDRIFGDDLDNATDDILRLIYTLETPLVLEPGEYWFSHDAVIPEPASVAMLSLGSGLLLLRRRRR